MTEPVRPEDMRISDAERTEVQDRLRLAHDVGRLDLGEFDERVKSVWAARTRGELARVTADLPASPSEPGRRTVFSDTGGGMTIPCSTWPGSAARPATGDGSARHSECGRPRDHCVPGQTLTKKQNGWPTGSRMTRTFSCGWNSASVAPASSA
ncbi:DUF1707 domain-containing protein [Pseudonocardia sp. DSM 110487]|nr:DUF1707 domain-containing protein [Pseudonocardia sp. DSM 110487]